MLYSEFDCSDCPPETRVKRGHDEDAPVPYWTDIKGEPQARCPYLPLFNDPTWFNKIMSAYNSYKAGFLPNVGAMGDQPALFPELMSVFGSALDTAQATKRKTEPRKG